MEGDIESQGHFTTGLEMIKLPDNKTYAYNPIDTVMVEIGDSKQSKFYPQAKIMRWDNEVNFSMRLKNGNGNGKVVYDDTVNSSIPDRKGKVTWSSSGIRCDFLHDENLPEGALKFDIILDSKPKSNIIVFTIETKGIVFDYQPPLNLDRDSWPPNMVSADETTGYDRDGKAICWRPENVVGSYAIYHASCPPNVTGGKEYRVGKLCHLYRPKVIDSTGKSVWGDWSLDKDNGLLNLIISQDFLDNALYPIVVDPDVGYTTAGASSQDVTASICTIGSGLIATSGAGDVLERIYVYASGTSLYVTLYQVPTAGSTPTSRFMAGMIDTLPGSPAWTWQDGDDLETPLTPNIQFGAAQGVHNAATVYFDTSTGASNRSAATGDTLPATWAESGRTATKYSQYYRYRTTAEKVFQNAIQTVFNVGFAQ